MPRHTTAVALAALVLLAGIGGLVTAAPTDSGVSTDANDTAANETGSIAPERNTTFAERLADRLAQFDLTDAQVREIVSEAVRLREAGASRRVIRSSVVVNLWEAGVDAPWLYADPAEKRLTWLAGAFDLTDEQVAELEATIEERRAAGANRSAIRAAVLADLASSGIDEDAVREARREARTERARATHERAHRLGERAHELHHRAHALHGEEVRIDRIVDRLRDRHDLTDAQAAEVEATIRTMRADGAGRSEIRGAVAALLDSYGVERTDG